ncbi:MAG: ABC transporter permease, partial [Clostridia bacterium]|nr:ABC transporter permease [Clostridia bacterium]
MMNLKKPDKSTFSKEHAEYLKAQKRYFLKIKIFQIGIVFLFFALWETFSRFKLIDTFITSSPLRIWNTLIYLN